MDAKATWDKYQPDFLELLRQVGEACKGLGLTWGEPEEWTDEEYSLAGAVTLGKRYIGVVSLTLTEEGVCEGDGEGLGFLFEVIAEGGQILYSFAPENYTPEVWAYDEAGLAELWEAVLAGVGPDEVARGLQGAE
jgi:hypothetical protein